MAMQDTQGETFEDHMVAGLEAHRHGAHAVALAARLQAFHAEPPEAVDRGRAARDVAASFDRLGDDNLGDERPISNEVLAAAYADYAVYDHQELVKQGSETAKRELTVSDMYAGLVATRQALSYKTARRAGIKLNEPQLQNEAVYHMRRAREMGATLRDRYGKPHQYDVNLSGRAAVVESLFGNPRPARELAKEALNLAVLSESSSVLGYNPELSDKERRSAQQLAQTRAKIAHAVARLNIVPTPLSASQRLARFVAKKYVL